MTYCNCAFRFPSLTAASSDLHASAALLELRSIHLNTLLFVLFFSLSFPKGRMFYPGGASCMGYTQDGSIHTFSFAILFHPLTPTFPSFFSNASRFMIISCFPIVQFIGLGETEMETDTGLYSGRCIFIGRSNIAKIIYTFNGPTQEGKKKKETEN